MFLERKWVGGHLKINLESSPEGEGGTGEAIGAGVKYSFTNIDMLVWFMLCL